MEEIEGGGRSVVSEKCKLGSVKSQLVNLLQNDHRISFGYLKRNLRNVIVCQKESLQGCNKKYSVRHTTWCGIPIR